MTYTKKYGKGWFRESERHRLARQGIKTKNRVRLIPTLSPLLPLSYYKKKSPGSGPYPVYEVSYSKIDYSMMNKIQSFLHKHITIKTLKQPKHIQQSKEVVSARHDIEKVTNWEKFREWTKKHRKTITYLGLGGLMGVAAATAGLPTIMQNIHTGEIVAFGGTFIGKWGMVGQTVLTGMGVIEEAKVISKDTQKQLFKGTLISPQQLKIEQKAIVFKVKPSSYSKYSRYFPKEDNDEYGDLEGVSSPSIPYSQLTQQEKKVLNTSISKVKSVLGKRGKTIVFNKKNLQIVKRVGPDDTAFGAHQGDLIQIDRDTLKDPDKTEGVLLHESLHKIYGVRDETRELENLHIDYLGELM